MENFNEKYRPLNSMTMLCQMLTGVRVDFIYIYIVHIFTYTYTYIFTYVQGTLFNIQILYLLYHNLFCLGIMPLIIDDCIIDSNTALHPSEIFKSFPKLKEASMLYIKDAMKNKRKLDCSDRVLYVMQREYASISREVNKLNFRYVATDDATTCHIVIFIEKTTNTISLGHFDGADTTNGIKNMIYELSDISGDSKGTSKLSFDMFVFGGFIDERRYSEELFIGILFACRDLTVTIELKLACTYSINSELIHKLYYPKIYGVAVAVETCEIVLGNCIDQGPDLVLREARIFSYRSQMSGIYNYKDHCVCIQPFSYQCISNARHLLRLPDEEYLRLMSTSPHCEPEHFVKSSKNVIMFTAKFKNPLKDVFNNKTRKYILNEQHKWIVLDADHVDLN